MPLKKKQKKTHQCRNGTFFFSPLNRSCISLHPINKPDHNRQKSFQSFHPTHPVCYSKRWVVETTSFLSVPRFASMQTFVFSVVLTHLPNLLTGQVLSHVLGISEYSEPAEPIWEAPPSKEVNMSVTCSCEQRKPVNLFPSSIIQKCYK